MEPTRTSPVTAVVTLLKPFGDSRTVEFDWSWPKTPWRPEPGDTITFGVDLKLTSDTSGNVWQFAYEGASTAETLAAILRRNGAIRNVRVRL